MDGMSMIDDRRDSEIVAIADSEIVAIADSDGRCVYGEGPICRRCSATDSPVMSR